MIINANDRNNYENRFWVNLINSLSGFKSANLIGTLSKDGVTNLAIFNSVIHIGANPPLMGFIMRPVNVDRHTYKNIKETGSFTINHINKNIFRQAHQTSARYNEDVSEFNACGFTHIFSESISAPYVKESNIKIGLEFEEEDEIKSNKTILIVGRILEIILPNEIMAEDGFIDIEKAGTVAISGLDSYYETKRIARLSYAKPFKDLQEIK